MDKQICNIIQDISDIVKYDSSQAAPVPGANAPFGAGARASLDYFLSLAASFGFETKDYDGYAGEVTWGDGEEFAVLVHMDVVPAGTGWTHEPFKGEIDHISGRIWGRGTMDDKGPAVIFLYAMKALKDSGFVPKRRIKLIAGCNEETGWKCIDYYTAHAHMPDEGISPDADFPVIYAEKGILQIQAEFPVSKCAEDETSIPMLSPLPFTAINGGTASNMVCGRCEAKAPKKESALEAFGLTYDEEAGTVISVGKAAHGSTPEKGINAIRPILTYLGLEAMNEQLFGTYMGLRGLEDETGPLTFSPNIISYNAADDTTAPADNAEDSAKAKAKQDGIISVVCDIRYPATMKEEDIRAILDKSGIAYTVVHAQDPLYNDKNGRLISTLLGVYNEVTGQHAEPIAIGGGTYARALKNGAGFGPEEEGENCPLHEPDEYITFEKIQKCFKIYKLALQRLCG